MSDLNFRSEILRVADKEPILAVVFGNCPDEYSRRYRNKDPLPIPPIGVLLSWEEAEPYIDYDYYPGFGGIECHAIYAWTESKIIQVHEYDGSTRIKGAPRHPEACIPEYA